MCHRSRVNAAGAHINGGANTAAILKKTA